MANKSRSSLYATSSREAAPRLTQYSLPDASNKRIVNNGLDKPDAADIDASMQFIDQV